MPPPRTRRWPRRLLLGLLASVVVVQGVFWWSVRLPIPDVQVPDPGRPTMDGAVARLGDSSLERRDGYWFFVHRGDALTLGAQHARLGEFLIQRVEDALFVDFRERMPIALRLLLPPYLMWTYRRMPHALPPEQQEELWAFSTTYADRAPLHPYRRGMYYHALHDMTQELVGNRWVDPAVAGACTAFAATGPATVDGHLVLARNFDFEVFPLFDDQKVVHLFAREGTIPSISVSWMAMSGVVTGMNAEGIWISLNSARTVGHNRDGPPVSLRLRTILEQARDLDDVRRLVAEQSPLVSNIFLVGDGETGEGIVLERGIERVAERAPVDGRISAANHMLTDAFAGDAQDQGMRDYTTTLARGQRIEELVAEAPMSPRRAQAVLRDRRAPGGGELALGNRNAVDALIATHSLIADATDRVLWVSTAPHTLGPFRAIDLLAELDAAGIDTAPYRATLAPGARAWEATSPAEPEGTAEAPPRPPAPSPPADLPADPFLVDGGWDRLQQARSHLEDGEAYLEDDRWALARDMAERVEQLLPRTPDAPWLRAEAARGEGDDAAARAALLDYLDRLPPRGPRTAQAEAWLAEHGTPTLAAGEAR
jgi:isopenicillin-N N-acyltransferase-like protein